ELLRGVVVYEQRGVATDVGGCPIHQPVVGEFGHLWNFNAVDDAISNGNLCFREALAESEAEGAQVHVDVPLRAGLEVTRQRPVTRSDHKCGIHRDQERRADNGLGPEVKSQEREAGRVKSECHLVSPEKYGLELRGLFLRFPLPSACRWAGVCTTPIP